jgi:Holliday junction resolvase RusA-like endonuclease
MDAMNGIVYKDDSQVTMATIEKAYDKNEPGVYVLITEDV